MHHHVVPAHARHLLPKALPIQPRLIEPSALENQFLLLGHHYNSFFKIFFKVQLNGPRLNADDLSRALEALQRKHPTLRTRPIAGQDASRFLMEENALTKIKVLERVRAGVDDWRKIHAAEVELKQLQLNRDPNSVYLIQPPRSSSSSATETYDLVLSFQHYCLDGASMPHMVNELLQILSGSKDPSTIPLGSWVRCVALIWVFFSLFPDIAELMRDFSFP